MTRTIDFYVAGAHKAGTSTLAGYIGQHPDVWLPSIGEDALFGRDDLYGRLDAELDLRYRSAPAGKLLGGKFVHAMFLPESLERMRLHNPNMSVLLILRDPVQRAWSSYWFARAHGWERLSFEEAVDAEMAGERTGYVAKTELSHIAHGMYAGQVQRCLDLFSARCKVLLLDDLQRYPRETMRSVLNHLQLPPGGESCIDFSVRKNEAFEPRLPWLTELAGRENAVHKRIARVLLPRLVRFVVDAWVVRPLLALNARARPYPPMPSELRARLEDIYREPTRELERVLARRVPWTCVQ